ncbi:MAG TPA: ATP-dependent helicase [Mycobacteriales bacterium]|nr:ATP-dependent helicase [Mycobacteriales bacterium]
MTALDRFSPATRAWFEASFAEPTAAQAGAWDAVAGGRHALVIAPTGSGKTLAAFLHALDRLLTTPAPEGRLRRCRVLYVSPLKALAVDVERNLRAPLAGIRHAATRLGGPLGDVAVGMRTGDTPTDERRAFARRPPDILITTPESLFLLLTSQAREALRGVDTVIVDEVHAVAGSKRGAHLALSLERLDALLDKPAQRIGLSATVRPVDEIARFLGGTQPVTVVQPPASKTIAVDVVVPVEDMTELGEVVPDAREGSAAGGDARRSIWPAVEERIVDLVEAHRSTIVFANSRRLAERLTNRLNEIAYERRTGEQLPEGPPPAEVIAQAGATRGAETVIARAHHGSVSREQRALTEEALKRGDLPCVVATSSLELGIDMGAVDLVVQVEPPPSVASGLQRIGRAGHQVGAVSKGVMFPKHRGDLVPAAVTSLRMTEGAIEAVRLPRNPLDVLAQHVVAMCAMDSWSVDDLAALARRTASFATLPDSVLHAVLDMLAGRYPSDEFAELRPRIVWDRVTGSLTARPGAQRLAVTSGGTIPDRGLFGVFLAGADTTKGNARVGELDEEMVYESRAGDVFTLGSTSWRIEEITHDRVLVSPAPGQPGKLPFWHGDAPGRPVELGRALGAFVRELQRLDTDAALAQLTGIGLDEWAAANTLAYLAEQRESTGHVPDDRTIVVERFRDELGDWRVAVHSPFGAQVHAPWGLALQARLRERFGVDVQVMHTDDGIVLRLPQIEATGSDEPPPPEIAVFDPDEVEPVVTDEVGGSALFASRFRECAARALLLPKRNPGKRTPLWQQRQRSAQLLSVASQYGSFPIVLETMRECLQDVFDVPGLTQLMRDVSERTVRIVDVETQQPSPMARSLLFGYIGQFMYEGDQPLAERRAAALALDSTLLAELLGTAELRELLDADAVDEIEAELQRLTDDRKARDTEGVADLLRLLGDLSTDDAVQRGATPAMLAELEEQRRAIRVRVAGVERWIGVEDASRYRDALGTPMPVGVAQVFLDPVDDPLGDLLSRYARTHGPFHAIDVAARLGLGLAVVEHGLHRLAGTGRVVQGEFRPAGAGLEWCDANVLRSMRRRSLARLRKEVEPVPQQALGRFLPAWQGIGQHSGRGPDALVRAIEQLQGAAVPASMLETVVLPSRVADYSPAMLDELTSSGDVLWVGQAALPGGDGWVSLHLADTAPLLMPVVDDAEQSTMPLHEQVLEVLSGGGALFFRHLSDRLGSLDDRGLAGALWDLVWAGRLTNDTMAPLRAVLGGSRRPAPRVRPGRRGRPVMPVRSGPPSVAGRWSLLPDRDTDPTRRAHALTEALLDRHGVLTRGAVGAEHVSGGFAAVYPVLKAFEETGRCRRGYFVEGLGGAQFAMPGAVDRMRALAAPARETDGWQTPVPGGWRDRRPPETSRALVLAAADPANPYGAALPWPARPSADGTGGHKPGRKAGALVVLVDGDLALYVERGGKSLLSWSDDPECVQPAADALALAVRDGMLGKLAVERADGEAVLTSPLGAALEQAGFRPTPRGLRLRA